MSDEVNEVVNTVLAAPESPPAPVVPPHVAANIVEFLKRVQVTGMEAFALVEAMGCMRQFAAPPPSGPGVPFPGL